MYNFVIFATPINLYRYMYKDMAIMDNVQIYWEQDELLKMLPCFWRKVAGLHMRSPLPMKRIWYFWASKSIKFENNNPLCFIWHHRFLSQIENGMVEYLRKSFPQSKHIYFFTDQWTVNNDSVKFFRNKMDKVAVFDYNIAKKYQIMFLPNVYPDAEKVVGEGTIKYDICFVGHDKGREGDLQAIARLCEKNDIRTAFYIARKEGVAEGIRGNINYIDKKLAYTEVVEIIKSSNCILELNVEPDRSCSLRIQEAVVWNKKLITNNRNVGNMPCCKNSRWIHYFDKPEDIDWNFVKRNEDVDYHYQGEYSAVNWLHAIEEYCHNNILEGDNRA